MNRGWLHVVLMAAIVAASINPKAFNGETRLRQTLRDAHQRYAVVTLWFSPDSRTVHAVCLDADGKAGRSVQVNPSDMRFLWQQWSVPGGKLLQSAALPADFQSLRHDGKVMVLEHDDAGPIHLRCADRTFTLRHQGRNLQGEFTFSPDGHLLAVGMNNTESAATMKGQPDDAVLLWDTRSGKLLKALRACCYGASLQPRRQLSGVLLP